MMHRQRLLPLRGGFGGGCLKQEAAARRTGFTGAHAVRAPFGRAADGLVTIGAYCAGRDCRGRARRAERPRRRRGA
ncbi:hypothetical protein WS68_06050 [Burkholderia sp. TSV86]|nr:hypothetical protein WS68_06050 [Burkholderia sp. TSV86]